LVIRYPASRPRLEVADLTGPVALPPNSGQALVPPIAQVITG
jgi:hypothetical protein